MKLREIVVDKAIVPNLVATKLEDAIHELLNALVESGRVSPDMRETFAKSILAREKKGSTGLNHGVAIPHTKTTAVKSPLAAVGISRTGVDFNALIEEYENRLISTALNQTGGNKKAAAKLLGLNRTTLVEKIKKKGLEGKIEVCVISDESNA